MTVKDIAQRTGLTSAAIYKRIKAKGYSINTLKKDKNGHFTPDGERLMIELFNLDNAPEQADSRPKNDVDNRVAELTTEIEKLKNQVELLTSERDSLREILEREQQLHAMALKLLPPPSEKSEKSRFRAAWDALRGRR